jgi:hypothetical protein
MSKLLSKSVLKEIVKECIVEIFSESFAPSVMTRAPKSTKSTLKREENVSRTYNSRKQTENNYSENFLKRIDETTSKVTSDPIMKEIFSDTAKTTLQNQISAEQSKGVSVLAGGDAASKIAYSSDPTELFAESANKWAALAFGDTTKK